MWSLVLPVLHTYVLPPVAVSVVLWPWQIDVDPTMDGVGSRAVVTTVETADEHPLGSVTVTV